MEVVYNNQKLIIAIKKGNDILVLGIGPTQGLGENSLTAEKCVLLILQ